MKSAFAILGIAILSILMTFVLLIITRLFVESRYLPTNTMEPTLAVNDRVVLEKSFPYLHRPYVRGEIIVFYPPPIELGGRDLSWNVMPTLGRLSVLPFFPYEPAFIKRVIGLPGDCIRIVKGQGVFVNGKLLDETSYVKEPVNYDLNILGDIGGRSVTNQTIRPYSDPSNITKPIVVPPGQLFVLGDNRNHSEDSHVFGLLDEQRVIGRVILKFPKLEIIDLPKY